MERSTFALAADIEWAKEIIANAKAELGDDLCGYSVRDLLCDNMPKHRSWRIDQILENL